MKCTLISLLVASCVLWLGTLSHAALLNRGDDGEFFYDDQTCLYWYDPSSFAGRTIDEINTFVSTHSTWKWADRERLMSLSSGALGPDPDATSFRDVLGVETYTDESLYYWIGFIDPQDAPVAVCLGWDSRAVGISMAMELYSSLEDDENDPALTPVPVISGTILHGAWLYSESDPLGQTAPVPEPSTVFLIGTGLVCLAGAMKKFGRK